MQEAFDEADEETPGGWRLTLRRDHPSLRRGLCGPGRWIGGWRRGRTGGGRRRGGRRRRGKPGGEEVAGRRVHRVPTTSYARYRRSSLTFRPSTTGINVGIGQNQGRSRLEDPSSASRCSRCNLAVGCCSCWKSGPAPTGSTGKASARPHPIQGGRQGPMDLPILHQRPSLKPK